MRSVERKGNQVTAIISHLTKQEYERLCGQLEKWYCLGPQVLSREGDRLTFNAENSGRDNAPILAGQVEGLFIGFLLGRES